MPAVSAEDCLFADLRLDPSDGGCYSIEATQFILENKFFDPSSHVIIWQIGMIGNLGQPSYQVNASAIQCLVRKLLKIYPKDFQAILYEASVYPGLKPSINRFKISTLYEQQLSPISTLYIPPLENKSINEAILREIGITKNSH